MLAILGFRNFGAILILAFIDIAGINYKGTILAIFE